PLLYLGKQVTLDDLGVAKSAKPGQHEAPAVAAKQINCPNCGGGLTLKAPDKTERVGCPYCGSLLDLQAGNLKLLKSLKPATYQGKAYTLYQRTPARMEYVVGECYWKVEVGETVEASDFIKPPEMLSQEVSRTGKSEEINWSLGTYMTPAEVRKTFGVGELP